MDRRKFLQFSSMAGLSSLILPNYLIADDEVSFNDFKAMVIIDMQGGNDALNTIIPTGDDTLTGYSNYANIRGNLAISDNNLTPKLKASISSDNSFQIANVSSNPYYTSSKNTAVSYKKGFYLLEDAFKGEIGINALMPEVAYWMNRGRGAVIQNVGNMIAPYTKAEMKADHRKLPPSTFAHYQQQLLANTGSARSLSIKTGWLGRLADRWGNLNHHPFYKMNVNLAPYGNNSSMFGVHSTPMNYSIRGPVSINKFIDKGFEEWVHTQYNSDLLRRFYMRMRQKSYYEVKETIDDWKYLDINNPFESVVDVYGNAIFKNKSTNLNQLGIDIVDTRFVNHFISAAKLIAIAKRKGFKRMVISIRLGGFDQHSWLAQGHGMRIRGLSLGIDAFMRAMEANNWLDEVAVVTMSEFSRTAGGNSSGTDHAWGGAYFVLGDVKGGNYGRLPNLTLGSEQDYTNKGRYIPDISFSQYYATLLKWFGADKETIKYALPEIINFDVKDIGFMHT